MSVTIVQHSETVAVRTRDMDVDSALEAWARWGKGGLAGMGWPQMTLLAKVIAYGFTGAAQSGALPEIDEAVRAVEQAVLRLSYDERRVIVKHYLYWQSTEDSARHCHMNPVTFRTILHRARRRVRDFLDGMLCSNKFGCK